MIGCWNRDPLEVLVSQARIPALFMIPGFLVRHGLTPPESLPMLPLAHGAWVLSQILQTAARAIRHYPGGLLVNYTQLPEVLGEAINAHFRLDLNVADVDAIRLAASRDAKNPQRVFEADSAKKHADADASVRDLAARWLAEPYRELEALRCQSAAPGVLKLNC